jgi:cytochrome c
MGSRRIFPFAFVLPVLLIGGASALAQGPTYGIGRTPTAEEIKALDISIGPTGEELPHGKGNAKEGAQLYRTKGCAACHGAEGLGGTAPNLKSKDPKNPDVRARGRILPLRAPFATTVWDYINRGMPLNREGTLTADEVLADGVFINDGFRENQAPRSAESAPDQDAHRRQMPRYLPAQDEKVSYLTESDPSGLGAEVPIDHSCASWWIRC